MVKILPYLIMAAIEREERGGAIAYWGVKTFRIGNQVLLAYTNICLLCTADIPIGSEEIHVELIKPHRFTPKLQGFNPQNAKI